jgi:hypothetical protein
MRAAEPDVKLPPLNVFWSTANRPADGEASKGMISTSHYEPDAATNGLYILGAENVDTDEYDSSVIVHEFGHYVEDKLSRSDSIGGSHSPGDLLDMRVAFGEGWGNSFSSMMRGTPVYTDTNGLQQASTGIAMNLGVVPASETSAWFNESAVGNLLYSLYVSPDVGFAPIYHTMLNGEKDTLAMTSLFSFAAKLRPGLSSAGQATLDKLLAKVLVNGGAMLDEWGNSAGVLSSPVNAAILPVYVKLAPGESASSCTTTALGPVNKLGTLSHLRLTVPAAGTYSLAVEPQQEGAPLAKYSIEVFQAGKTVSKASTSDTSASFVLTAPGDYTADVAPAANLEADTPVTDSVSCVTVSLRSGS